MGEVSRGGGLWEAGWRCTRATPVSCGEVRTGRRVTAVCQAYAFDGSPAALQCWVDVMGKVLLASK